MKKVITKADYIRQASDEQLKETQNRLRQNQFDRLYYQYTEEQLVDEYNRLKKIYLEKNDKYRFFIP